MQSFNAQNAGPINSYQELWDATIALYKAREFDTTAMANVYNRMNPKLTYFDLASVFSGVYADTYWAGTYMDPELLAKSMNQALGLDKGIALNYSQSAMGDWRGSLVRANTNDTGKIPRTSDYSQSLDIVCNQNTEIPNSTLIKQWNNEFWEEPQVGKNFLYTRVQNQGFYGEITPEVRMYFTDGGFNQPPSSWIKLFTVANTNEVGKVYNVNDKVAPLNLGGRGASEAFYFDPSSTAHVCIIAAVVTEFFTQNDPAAINGNWNSSIWITHNGAAGWHNVNPQSAAIEEFKFYNQDGSPERFAFVAELQNVPEDYTVSLRAEDSSLALGSGVQKVRRGLSSLRTEATLPGYYNGELEVAISGPNGELLPENAAVKISMYWILPKGHARHAEGAQLLGNIDAVLQDSPVELFMGSYTLRGRA